MKYEEELEKYDDILQTKYQSFIPSDPENDDKYSDELFNYLNSDKERIHSAAMDCLSKILSPALKVFVRNLCYNKLGYPDEPIFYDMFGNYPEVGDKVSIEEIREKGLDIKTIDSLKDEIWFLEGNWIEKESIDGKEYYVIKDLYEILEEESEEKLKKLRTASKIRKFLIDNKELDDSKKLSLTEMLDSLLPKNWQL